MSSVLIKNQRYGLSVRLPAEGSFPELRAEVEDKFKEAAKFFGPAHLTLTFEGRSITEEEENLLIDSIERCSEIRIICVFVNDTLRNSIFLRARSVAQGQVMQGYDPSGTFAQAPYSEQIEGSMEESAQSGLGNPAANDSSSKSVPEKLLRDNETFTVYPGNLKNGETYKTKENILILGEIEQDAVLISSKSVAVIGAVYGTVKAGEGSGMNGHFVLSSHLVPKKITIDHIEFEDKIRRPLLGRTAPGMIRTQDGEIMWQELSEEGLQELLSTPDLHMITPRRVAERG